MALVFHQIPVWPFQANCTIISDATTKRAIVVDPGGEAQVILEYLKNQQLTLDSIWLTHAHYDHLSALNDMPPQAGVPLFIHEDDIALFQQINQQAQIFCLPELAISWPVTAAPTHYQNGPFQLVVLPTPGHSPGGICLYFPSEETVLVGDTLFAHGGVGRTDFIGGSMPKLLDSIKNQLFTLPDSCRVLCGHGRPTTIGAEKQFHH